LTTIFSDMTMFLWLSKSSDSSCKIPNGSMTQNSTEHVIVMRTYSEVLDGIFQWFHVSRNAFVSTELILRAPAIFPVAKDPALVEPMFSWDTGDMKLISHRQQWTRSVAMLAHAR
jgi:hypothetical protein